MSGKRFDVGNLKIQDNAPKGRVYLLDMQGGVNALCSLINGLNDKSNRLEKVNEQLKQQLSEQGTQIDFLKDENKHMRKVLEENKELKQDLKQIQDSLWATEHIRKLEKENEKLKTQLYCNHDGGVCSICKHCYLEEQSLYYISKCEKGHEECSKEDLRYCKDFEVKELEND